MLLNTIYKMYAKAIALRLQPYLDSLIHGSEFTFIQNCSIFDNIFVFWESIHEVAKCRHNDIAILMLDFEKAYDHIDWDFLNGVLGALGFHHSWIVGVEALNKGANSKIPFANGMGYPFQISRLARQGHPLTPFLYLFLQKHF